MKETAILFSAEMMAAIWALQKTQTRRVINPQPVHDDGTIWSLRVLGPEMYAPAMYDRDGEMYPGPDVFGIYDEYGDWGRVCPYGRPGDLLVPRSTWATLPDFDHLKPSQLDPAAVADFFWIAGREPKPGWVGKTRPGRFLPKILWHLLPRLEILRIGAERVQEISEVDARAEGVGYGFTMNGGWPDYQHIGPNGHCSLTQDTAVASLASLWDRINAKRGYPWSLNSWVWVLEFRLIGVSNG